MFSNKNACNGQLFIIQKELQKSKIRYNKKPQRYKIIMIEGIYKIFMIHSDVSMGHNQWGTDSILSEDESTLLTGKIYTVKSSVEHFENMLNKHHRART